LCATFQGPTIQDLLLPRHEASVDLGVTKIIGGIPGLTPTSHILFSEDDDFDVTDLTVEMSVNPDQSAARGSATLLDHGGQYAVSYVDQHVQCKVGAQVVESDKGVAEGLHHVACRYDATTGDLRVYIDGSVAGCASAPAGMPMAGNTGLAIGASYDGLTYRNNYVGILDRVHLYASAIPEAKICTAAGKMMPCPDRCPEGGDGGPGGGGGRRP
jgi:hypothetical protein